MNGLLDPTTAPPAPGTPGRRRRAVPTAVLVGLAAASALAFLLTSGLLPGRALLPAAALVVAFPSAAALSRRLLLNGATVLGLTPVLWWLPAPPGVIGRSGLLVCLGVGALTAWVLLGADRRSRCRSLVPAARPADLLLPATGLVGLVAAWPLLFRPTAGRLLDTWLAGGTDNVAHFSMYLQQRSGGLSQPLVAGPLDGSEWYYQSYPQLLHSLLAAVTELRWGGVPVAPLGELPRYAQAVGLVWVAVAVLVVAAVLQVGALRSRPGLAAVLASVVAAVLLGGPGLATVAHGHLGLVVAATAVGLAVCVLPEDGVLNRPSTLVPMAGLVVTACAGWALLAPVVLAVLVPAVGPTWRQLRRSPRSWWLVGPVLAGTTAALLLVAVVLLRNQVGSLTAGGAVSQRPWVEVVGVVGTAAVLGWLQTRSRRTAPQRPVRSARTTAAMAVPLTAAVCLAALVAFQLVVVGRVDYYAYKLALGVEFVGLPLVVTSLGTLLRSPRRGGGAGVVAAVAVGAALVLVPTTTANPLAPPAVAADGDPVTGGQNVQRLVRAVDAAALAGPWRTTYVAVMPGEAQPRLYDFWLRALTETWSTDGARASAPLGEVEYGFASFEELTDVVSGVLGTAPDRVVVVAPNFVDGLRMVLPQDADRIQSW